MTNRILLVGLEPMRLRETTGFLSLLASKWTIVTASAAAQAMDLLGQSPFTAVVSDLHLPGTEGPRFLDAVLDQFPSTQRFLLADLANKQTILKCVGTAHHFLSTPCDARKLLAAVDRAQKLEVWFASDNVKKLVAQMQKVPSPPAVYFQVVKELQSPTSSLGSVGAIIARDPAITAKLLQLVNSAAFGLQSEVGDPGQAVMFLGMVMTKSLILLAHTYSHFDHLDTTNFSVEALWRHSLGTARLAEALARSEGRQDEVVEESFTAGLLHDIGKLLIAANQPDKLKEAHALAQDRQIAVWEAEQLILGTTHAELGAWLAAVWGLPLTIVEALALHHNPSKFLSKSFCPLTAVHVANILERERNLTPGEPVPLAPDVQYLTAVGVQDRLEEWREICTKVLVGPDR